LTPDSEETPVCPEVDSVKANVLGVFAVTETFATPAPVVDVVAGVVVVVLVATVVGADVLGVAGGAPV
jgi:hypothetical protein